MFLMPGKERFGLLWKKTLSEASCPSNLRMCTRADGMSQMTPVIK